MSQLTGTKNGAGIAERICGQIPPHKVRIEAFWGRGTISRRISPCEILVGMDLDPVAIDHGRRHGATMFEVDAERFLDGYFHDDMPKFGNVPIDDHFIYLDPPYLTTIGKGYYRNELSRDDHARLLDTLCRLPQPLPVAISHAVDPLYESMLSDWRRIEYDARTHVGSYRECLWCNYDEPEELHDPRFAGRDHRHREAIKKRATRWAAGLARMPRREQHAVVSAVLDVYNAGSNGTAPDGL